MGKEIELKYVFQHPTDAACVFDDTTVKASMICDVKVIRMCSEYYDTADKILSRSKAALRRRSENCNTVFTVKTAGTEDGALSTRGEWQISCSTLDEAVDKFSQIEPLRPLFVDVSSHNLTKTATIDFTRICADIALPGGGVAELCVDTGLFLHCSRSAPFYELELELKQGSAHQLQAFGNQLQHKFQLLPEPRSKLARALEL